MKTFRIDVDDYAAGNGVLFGRVAHDEAIADKREQRRVQSQLRNRGFP